MIKKLKVNHFTVFPKADFVFGDKLNILIGENGSGKTQILKFLYAAGLLLQSYQKRNEHFIMMASADDVEIFRSTFKVGQVADLINMAWRNKKTTVRKEPFAHKTDGSPIDFVTVNVAGVKSTNQIVISNGTAEITYDVNLAYYDVSVGNMLHTKSTDIIPDDLFTEVLFLPTHELLSIYPNYQSLSKKYDLPYDRTYNDCIAALGLPYEKESSKEYDSIVKTLEDAIGGRIFLKDEKFFFHPASAPENENFAINMTAEGWRKLGMMLQLLKNGSLHKDMMLFWDEPEANLNPRLIRLIAKVIVELSKLGIQVFMATHSLFLLREIDMLTKGDKDLGKGAVRYFNFLGKGKVEQGDTPEDLDNILLLEESLKQSDRYLEGDF